MIENNNIMIGPTMGASPKYGCSNLKSGTTTGGSTMVKGHLKKVKIRNVSLDMSHENNCREVYK